MKTWVRMSVAVAVLWVASPAAAGRWESIESLPGQSAVMVLVDERPRAYFRITPRSPLQIGLQGPARLRVVSRAEFAGNSAQVVSYTLRAREGSRDLDAQRTESSASGRVKLAAGNGSVGKSRRMVVDVPSGRHSIELSVEGNATVLVRLQQGAPSNGRETMVTLTPIEAPRSVTVIEGEKTISYYTTFIGRPVRMRVIGPTVLDLNTRIDFDAAMHGTITYRLVVTDRGRRIRELRFKTTKATAAVFANLKDRIPSKFDRARITLDEGTHEIALELIEPKGGAAEIHARIPEPRVGNEE